MADLESAAKLLLTPMIQGKHVEILPEHDGTIATWALKTALTAQSVRGPMRPLIYEYAEWLYTQKSAPPHLIVRAMAYRGVPYVFRADHIKFTVGFRSDPSEVVDGEVVTILVGHLALQVVEWEQRERLKFGLHIPDDDAIIYVWPSPGTTRTFPSRYILDRDRYMRFTAPFRSDPRGNMDVPFL